MAGLLCFCWSSLAHPTASLYTVYGQASKRDFNERDGGEAATKIIAELADNRSDFELILTSTRKKWPS